MLKRIFIRLKIVLLHMKKTPFVQIWNSTPYLYKIFIHISHYYSFIFFLNTKKDSYNLESFFVFISINIFYLLAIISKFKFFNFINIFFNEIFDLLLYYYHTQHNLKLLTSTNSKEIYYIQLIKKSQKLTVVKIFCY